MTVVAATAVLAHGFATFQANAKVARERDYSSPAKFVEPKYANIGDMEAVSIPGISLIYLGFVVLRSVPNPEMTSAIDLRGFSLSLTPGSFTSETISLILFKY
jgi:hypothetical protein